MDLERKFKTGDKIIVIRDLLYKDKFSNKLNVVGQIKTELNYGTRVKMYTITCDKTQNVYFVSESEIAHYSKLLEVLVWVIWKRSLRKNC